MGKNQGGVSYTLSVQGMLLNDWSRANSSISDWSKDFRVANQNTECIHKSQWEGCNFLSANQKT